jgi:hypothetical protein
MATSTSDREAARVTEPRRAPRRVLTWIAIGLVALVAAVAVYWALTRSGTAPAPPAVTIQSAPPASSTTITDSFGSEPVTPTTVSAGQARTANGCLGGPDPYQAVIPAQQAATPDQVGAAEFALTFARWTVAYPIDPNAPEVLAQVAAPGYQAAALDGLDQYGRTLSAAGYTSAGTTPGAANQYRIQSGEQSLDPNHVSMDLIVHRHATRAGGTVEEVRGFITILMELDDTKHWRITGTLPPIGSDPFAPDAGAPWIPYVGTC